MAKYDIDLRESEEAFNRFRQDNQLIAIDMQSEDLLARARETQNEIRVINEDKVRFESPLLRLNQFIERPENKKGDFIYHEDKRSPKG